MPLPIVGESDFEFDVFLSYNSKDRKTVRLIADHLRKNGLRVWWDVWNIKPGDNILAKIEDGLECSRVLMLCMSANAFDSDWAQLEANTYRFRDPLNKERRFIPVRLDGAPVKGSLGQFSYIDWFGERRPRAYEKLVEASQAIAKLPITIEGFGDNRPTATGLHDIVDIHAYAFSRDGSQALTGDADMSVRLWDVKTGRCLFVVGRHRARVRSIVWSPDRHSALTGSSDNTVRLWDVDTGHCTVMLEGHTGVVWNVVWSEDRRRAISASEDMTLRVWDLEKKTCLQVLRDHKLGVLNVEWNADDLIALSCSADRTIRLWDLRTGSCSRVFEGHTDSVNSAIWDADRRHVLSGSSDKTLRLWNIENGRCLRVLEGHTGAINAVAWSPDRRYVLSCSADNTIRIWDVDTGLSVDILRGHKNEVVAATWSADGRQILSGDKRGDIRGWEIPNFLRNSHKYPASGKSPPALPDQVQYTNAKVLLVGDSGAGKTGLARRIAFDEWQVSESTSGAWATHWKLPVSSNDKFEREIWLWDFGGQADQRLIHQLYMKDTALVALVFDGQKEDVFETLRQWDRDLTRASSRQFSKLLVAGRVDVGGLRISRSEIDDFVFRHKFSKLIETSAKTSTGCDELRQAILDGIKWSDIPWRTSSLLFKRLKDEIISLKDDGRVLMRFNELRDALQLRLSGELASFTDEELKAVIGLLSGPGVVWELKFGSWVLLQPERINMYAQAVIRTMRSDKDDRGCIAEERVLNGALIYQSTLDRLGADEERFVLLAMHQTLLERGLALREYTDQGTLLIFPSYYRRERPELVGHPVVLVSYRFTGFLDDIYATLVVRLHHTQSFEQQKLWRYAADFNTLTMKQLGVKLIRRSEGEGELDVYFDPDIPYEEKIIFSKYVHEHLLQNANNVVRLRYYFCPYCHTPVENREVAMRRLEKWLKTRPPETGTKSLIKLRVSKAPTIVCSECEKRVPLWDEMEQSFASSKMQQQVHDLREESALVLDIESNRRAWIGDVISTITLAGQNCRELNSGADAVDIEIEFNSDLGQATGLGVHLKLRSGDTHPTKRKARDSSRKTTTYPVVMVSRNSDGVSFWTDETGSRHERFDVMSVRRWRDTALAHLKPPCQQEIPPSS